MAKKTPPSESATHPAMVDSHLDLSSASLPALVATADTPSATAKTGCRPSVPHKRVRRLQTGFQRGDDDGCPEVLTEIARGDTDIPARRLPFRPFNGGVIEDQSDEGRFVVAAADGTGCNGGSADHPV